MIRAAIVGHSNLKQIPEHGANPWCVNNIQIDTFCCPGATASNLTEYAEYQRFIDKQFDVVVVFIGGNDITDNCKIANIYAKIKDIIEDIENIIQPRFGTHLLEPEVRTGDPRFIAPGKYYKIRTHLIRKIKEKRELSLWTLLGRGLKLEHLGSDGTHLNREGKVKLTEILEQYLKE